MVSGGERSYKVGIPTKLCRAQYNDGNHLENRHPRTTYYRGSTTSSIYHGSSLPSFTGLQKILVVYIVCDWAKNFCCSLLPVYVHSAHTRELQMLSVTREYTLYMQMLIIYTEATWQGRTDRHTDPFLDYSGLSLLFVFSITFYDFPPKNVYNAYLGI